MKLVFLANLRMKKSIYSFYLTLKMSNDAFYKIFKNIICVNIIIISKCDYKLNTNFKSATKKMFFIR